MMRSMGGLEGFMLNVIVSAPSWALASWMAARKVQTPLPVAVSQILFPGVISASSPILVTV